MATQDDFAAARYHPPVAVYYGSIPKFKPRYIALRGGSIDSNLQFCGSSWTTEEEASFQSILTTQKKKQMSLQNGSRDEEPPSSRAISPLDVWVSKASVHDRSTEDGSDFCHLSHQVLTQDPRKRDVNSAVLEIIKITDKLKMRRMSEGLLASQGDLTDGSDPKGVTLKPLVSRPTSRRLLVTHQSMPPIHNSLPSSESSRMSKGDQEHREDGTDCDNSDGSHKKLMSEGKGHKASLLPLHCSGGNGKKSLGMALIPPIPKSARPSDGAPDSTAVSLPSSQHLDFQEALEMRLRSGRRNEGKTHKSPELCTLEPVLPILQHRGGVGDVSAGRLCEPVPVNKGLSLNQAKEMDHLMSPCLPSGDNWKDHDERIPVTLSKSAQKKIQQKRMRQMEHLHKEREKEKEKEKSLQLATQSVVPGDSAKESFDPPPDNVTVSVLPSTSNAGRERAGTALRQRVNRLSLPSIPVISQNGSLPRKSSANSLPVIAADIPERGEEPEWGNTQEARAFPHPRQELLNALTWLSSDDWEQKLKGLFNVRCLAVYHSEVLLCRLHDVSLAVTKEVNNLRSKVSHLAIRTLGELFRTVKECMDHEVDRAAQVLLQRMGDSSEFIQKAADKSLEIMVGSVTPARAMTALMASGIQHRNVQVRKCATKHLLTVVEQIGAKKVLSSTCVNASLLVSVLVKLAQDCHQDTRCYALKMLNILMSHQKFNKYLKQCVPSHDLEDIMAKIKQKGIEDHKCEPPSVKSSGKARNSGLMVPRDKSHSGGRSGSDGHMLLCRTAHCRPLRTVEEIEQLNELSKLLTAKEFWTRIRGVELLLDHCKSSPQLISTNIVQIFDVFVLRLQDCNKKVTQQALKTLALMIPMLKGALHAVLVSLVEAVTDNLNSKHMGIYAAAVKALEASIAYLDNSLLLQAFAHRVRFLRGQALLCVTGSLPALVASVYPWKPQAVQRYALPILWFFLGNRTLPVRSGNIRTVVTKFAKTLYEVMGSKLKELANSQPQHVAENLSNILDLNDR